LRVPIATDCAEWLLRALLEQTREAGRRRISVTRNAPSPAYGTCRQSGKCFWPAPGRITSAVARTRKAGSVTSSVSVLQIRLEGEGQFSAIGPRRSGTPKMTGAASQFLLLDIVFFASKILAPDPYAQLVEAGGTER